jgi:hypothetical protein
VCEEKALAILCNYFSGKKYQKEIVKRRRRTRAASCGLLRFKIKLRTATLP